MAAWGAEPVAANGNEPAIGRLNHSGYSARRHCTFAAISPGVALTAAHCVSGVAPDTLHLLYGYGRMTWIARGSVERVAPLGGDLAALCLADAPPAVLGLGAPVERDDEVTVVGYGSPQVHLQQHNECRVWAEMGEEILLDCPSARGSSGGPLLNEAGNVVGVMSRTARGSSVALSVPQDAANACIGVES